MKWIVLVPSVIAAGIVTYGAIIRPRIVTRWGATDDEVKRTLPGDALTPDARLISTHAITINAPASEIWKWVVQIGNGRAGWYSFRWIEKLVGDGMLLDEGASWRILSQFQNLQVGDQIPVGGDSFEIMEIEPEHYMVLNIPSFGIDADTAGFAFVLEPIDANTTRLFARVRVDSKTLPGLLYLMGFFEPGHFIMQTKMLRGIKERAEAKTPAFAH